MNKNFGRTYRMLKEAFELCQSGRAVYVLCVNAQHAKELKDIYMKRFNRLDSSVKFESINDLSNFDYESMRLKGAHPNCVVLVDHYAIEYHFKNLLEMLHRYDEVNNG